MINMLRNAVKSPIIGVTIGDPAGVGPEICLKAILAAEIRHKIPVLLFADPIALGQAAQLLKLNIPFKAIGQITEFSHDCEAVQFVPGNVLMQPVAMGKIDALSGQTAFTCIKNATTWAMNNDITAIATAPIQKEALKMAQVPYPDHTEMFAGLTGTPAPMTLFVTGNLRVFFLTRHLALKDVPAAIGSIDIPAFLSKCREYLQQLGISQPRIALAALNPHGGEHGLFGTEESEILIPAIAQAREMDLDVFGPIPADSVFHQAHIGEFDAVLSLYHDQGHIATKTLDFYRTISYTMGLPFLRTSVDHGTAFDIAGQGIASAASMIEAILAAHRDGPKVKAAVQAELAKHETGKLNTCSMSQND